MPFFGREKSKQRKDVHELYEFFELYELKTMRKNEKRIEMNNQAINNDIFGVLKKDGKILRFSWQKYEMCCD